MHRKEANAFAIPGGRIYVFEGLIDTARDADELAGVLAHEIGHIAHRDGTRAVLQGAGLSFMFGMLLGDFVGGGAVVLAAKSVLKSSYSRDVEAAADVYGVGLMQKAGGNGAALAAILTRMGGATEPGMKILRDHPDTKARVAAITRAAGANGIAGQAMLSPGRVVRAARQSCKGNRRRKCRAARSSMSHDIAAGPVVGAPRLVRAGGRSLVGHHRPLGPARHRPGHRHLRRGAGIRGGRAILLALGELRRDLA